MSETTKAFPRVLAEYGGRRLVAIEDDYQGPSVAVEVHRHDAMGESAWVHVSYLSREIADLALTLDGEVLP